MSSTELDTHDRILKATWRLLEQRKGRGVRIQDIAQAAGVSRQAVYLHFPTRVDLLTATTHYIDSVLGDNERFQHYCSASTGQEKLDAYINFWGNYIPLIYGPAKALMEMQGTDEDASAAWKARMEDVYTCCLSVIQQLDVEHALSPEWGVEEAAQVMWTMLLIPNWEHLTIQCGWSNEKYVSRMQAILKKMFVK